jgi:signal transduction histidine kinase
VAGASRRQAGEEHGMILESRAISSRPQRPGSLSFRLAAIFGLLVAATVLVVTGVALAITRVRLERSLDGQLRNTAISFQRGPAIRTQAPGGLTTATRRWLAERPLPLDQMAAVRLADGRVLTSAGGLDLFEISHPGALLRAQRTRWANLQGREGGVRALTVPIDAHGRQFGTLVLLAYQRSVYRTLHALLEGIGAASAIGLALALLLGVLVVRRNLRPLGAIAADVARVEATGDLSRRVGPVGRGDEIGRLASAFNAMLIRLESAFLAQRRFLADASHELRTPVTVARAQLELVVGRLEAPERDAVALVEDELDRLARIIDDLLLLARLDEGLQLRREPVELELVLREALLRGLLLAPRQTRVQAEPNLYVLADPDRLLQVVTNLVTNAISHTDEHGCITLTAEQRRGHALIRVGDDGCGIPAHELPRIFERLYRGANERATTPEGSGLGLAIASSLVAAMNGTIGVYSIPANGTTFSVVLPLARAQDGSRGGHSFAPVHVKKAILAATLRPD